MLSTPHVGQCLKVQPCWGKGTSGSQTQVTFAPTGQRVWGPRSCPMRGLSPTSGPASVHVCSLTFQTQGDTWRPWPCRPHLAWVEWSLLPCPHHSLSCLLQGAQREHHWAQLWGLTKDVGGGRGPRGVSLKQGLFLQVTYEALGSGLGGWAWVVASSLER